MVVVNLDSHMDTVEVLGSVVCLRSCCDCVPCSPLFLSEECICPFGGLLARKKLFFFLFLLFTTKSHLVGFSIFHLLIDVLTVGICEAKSSYFHRFLAAS